MTDARDVPALSPLTAHLGMSATMAAAGAATGHPRPIHLAIGEPREAPPPAAVEAAVRAIRDGVVRYGPAAGLPELREECARDVSARTGLAFDAGEVLVTAGGKQGLHDALRCLAGPGDEVLVLAPYWPSFLQQVVSAGATPIVVQPGPDLRPDPGALAAAVTERTRVLILNDPSNPTSLTVGRQLLEFIAELAERHNLWVVLDEVYSDLVLEGRHLGLLGVAPELRERTIAVHSFSKRFAMTGYRLGALTAPLHVIEALTCLMTASLTCANTVAQHAALAALRDGPGWIEEQRRRYRRRRDAVLDELRDSSVLEATPPEAAFFVLARLMGSVDDVAWSAWAREEHGVLLVPGSAFGAPGFVRISCASPTADLLEGLRRIGRGVSESAPGRGA